MKCLFCSKPMPVTAVEHSHNCPEIGDGEGQCVRVASMFPTSIGLLLELASQVATGPTFNGWSIQERARKALDLAREEGVLS